MRTNPVAFALLLAAAGLFAGCEGMSAGAPPSRELSTAQFDDVPVPRGFVIDLAGARSFSYAEGGGGVGALRMGRLEYTGLGDGRAILDWYAAEMPRPMHGWSAGEPFGSGGRAMIFRRGTEACLVTTRDEGTQVRVVVERNTGGAIGRE